MDAYLLSLGMKTDEKYSAAEILKACRSAELRAMLIMIMVNYFFRKKILAHASGKGGGKLEQYTTAFIEVRTVITLWSVTAFQPNTVDNIHQEESGRKWEL